MGAPLFVTTDWVESEGRATGVMLVDARPPFFYAQGHLPGAVSLPALLLAGPSEPVPATVAARLGRTGIRPDSHIVLYDDGASPTASAVAWVLTYCGHERISLLDGGITKWASEGRELSYVAETPPPAEYIPGGVRSDLLARLDDLTAAINDSSAIILDVRHPSEYLGVQMTARRNGHVPGAINVDWSNNQTDEGGVARLRSVDELQALYRDAGVTPERPVIVHCQSGHRSTFTVAVLRHLGYERVRNYAAGWQEWGNRADTPIDEG